MGIFNFKRKKKEEKEFEQLENPTELLTVKLFFENEPAFNDEKIEQELSKRFKQIEFDESSDKPNNSRQYSCSSNYFCA